MPPGRPSVLWILLLFICSFPVAVGLCCRASFPSLRRGPLSLQCCSALAVAALAAGHRLGCLAACEFSMRILPGPGWNPCPCVGRQILNLGPPVIPETHIFQWQIWLFLKPFLILLIKILLISFIFSHNHSSFSPGKAQECYNITHL